MPIITGDGNTVYAGQGDDSIQVEGNRFQDHWSSTEYDESGSFYHLNVFHTYSYFGGYNQVYAEGGNDTVYAYCGVNSIYGGSGDDTVYIPKSFQRQTYEADESHTTYVQEAFEYENSGNAVYAGPGNDTIYAEGQASQSIEGEGDNDYIRIESNSSCNYIDGGDGNDTIMAYGAYETLAGGANDDFISVREYGADKNIDGGLGNDTVQLAAVGGRADLAAATHTASGAPSQSLIGFENAIGSALMEEVSGTSGGNRLDGQGGNDSLYGMDGNDSVYGGEGDDLLNGGAGLDVIDGGVGNDTASYNVGTTAGSIDLSTGKAAFAGVTEMLISIENATGSYGADAITGSDVANVLQGLTGNDTLKDLGGNDRILGDYSDDTLDGGTGSDNMSGGVGNDTYIVDTAGDVISEATAAGIDHVRSSIAYTLGANLENLTLAGMSAISGAGNDSNNAIAGNAAVNTLNGGRGNDSLSGGDAADRLIGGPRLVGGTGIDTLVWTATGFSGGDVAAGVSETAISGIGDRLDFTAALEKLLKVGGTALSAASANVTIGGDFSVGATNVRFSASSDVLQFDLSGNGTFTAASDFQVVLAEVNTVTYNAAGDYFMLGSLYSWNPQSCQASAE